MVGHILISREFLIQFNSYSIFSNQDIIWNNIFRVPKSMAPSEPFNNVFFADYSDSRIFKYSISGVMFFEGIWKSPVL